MRVRIKKITKQSVKNTLGKIFKDYKKMRKYICGAELLIYVRDKTYTDVVKERSKRKDGVYTGLKLCKI